MRISEYDAFGPWVYDVDGEHPLPPLFVPFVDMSKSWRMLLKIPRDIERRRATPDMDLYDFVVGADDAGIQIWSRREKAVEADLAGFVVPDEFVVGYGLDYAQLYRNLPYIGVLKPAVYEHT